MSRCVFSPDALADLEEIGDFIARDNPRRALTFVQELRARCRALAAMPYSGRARPELRPELRSRAVGAYLILYRPAAGGVEIVRIMHGSRDIDAEFDADG